MAAHIHWSLPLPWTDRRGETAQTWEGSWSSSGLGRSKRPSYLCLCRPRPVRVWALPGAREPQLLGPSGSPYSPRVPPIYFCSFQSLSESEPSR